jgi:hypothetical protein
VSQGQDEVARTPPADSDPNQDFDPLRPIVELLEIDLASRHANVISSALAETSFLWGSASVKDVASSGTTRAASRCSLQRRKA